jgi:nucleoside-diphosphate-sugar epimerase
VTKRNVLICGATGFIGRNTAEALVRRGDLAVTGVYNRRPPFSCPGLSWVKADLTRAEDVARVVSGADVIVQAAATTSGIRDTTLRPHIHIADNAVMNSLVFRAAHDCKVGHVVFFSCSVMLQSSEQALTENDFDANAEIAPRYFGIGWTKLYIEKMCEFYARLGTTKYTAIRHSNIYGPHDKFDLERSHVFGATVTKAMTAADGRLVVWGSGEEARDLLYVDDLVDFVTAAVDRQASPFALYNCGAGSAVKVKELVRMIVAASGRDLRIEHDLTKPTIANALALDCGKAERELGWRPKVTLDEGIRRTIAWWRDNVGTEAEAKVL